MFFGVVSELMRKGGRERVGGDVEGLRGMELDRQYGVRICLFGLRKGFWGFWSVKSGKWGVGGGSLGVRIHYEKSRVLGRALGYMFMRRHSIAAR